MYFLKLKLFFCKFSYIRTSNLSLNVLPTMSYSLKTNFSVSQETLNYFSDLRAVQINSLKMSLSCISFHISCLIINKSKRYILIGKMIKDRIMAQLIKDLLVSKVQNRPFFQDCMKTSLIKNPYYITLCLRKVERPF